MVSVGLGNFMVNGLQQAINTNKEVKSKFKDHSYSVEKRLKNYLKGEKKSEASQIEMGEYDKISTAIEEAPSPEIFANRLNGLDSETAGEYVQSYANAVGYLKEKVPTQYKQTLQGFKPETPGDADISKFLRLVNVVNNPESIFDKIDNDMVLAEEIDALDAVYPEYTELVRYKIADKLMDPKVELTSSQEETLGKVLKKVAPTYIADLQLDFKEDEEGPSEGPTGKSSANNDMATDITSLEHKTDR
jgi:hypothetical protein